MRNLRLIRNSYALPAIEPLFVALGLGVNAYDRVTISDKTNVLQQRIMHGTSLSDR